MTAQNEQSSGPTILLAEDDERSRHALRDMLEKEGYRVLEAQDGEEALRVAHRWNGPLRLLLTDVIMPHLNGVRLAEMLQREREGLRVLYLSGALEGVLLSRQVPSAAIVPKPVVPEALLRKIRATLILGTGYAIPVKSMAG